MTDVSEGVVPIVLDGKIKEKRDDVLAQLKHLALLRDRIDSSDEVAKLLRSERLGLWCEMSQLIPSVSWMDMARASGVRDVTIHNAVKGRKQA